MPIKITPIKKKKKDQSTVKGQGQSHPTRGDVTQVRTGKKSSGVADGSFGMGVFIKDKDKPRKKASGGKVGNVGKAMDKLSKKAIRKGGGSISEDKLISIMNKAGKSSGLFKKASGGKLKSVPEGKKGLSKLPTPVRNKMGFMKKGGMLNKKGKK